jgi:hypothetical protein
MSVGGFSMWTVLIDPFPFMSPACAHIFHFSGKCWSNHG